MDSVVQLGDVVPDFAIPDLTGAVHRLSDERGRIVILNFWSAECSWSARADEVISSMREDWGERVLYWPIAANFNETMHQIAEVASQRGIAFMLRDVEGITVDLYAPVTTPHFFVLDDEGLLRYKGALDDVTFRQKEASRSYLLNAIERLLRGERPDPAETPAYGCAIVHAYAQGP